jgi:hypothetical protein
MLLMSPASIVAVVGRHRKSRALEIYDISRATRSHVNPFSGIGDSINSRALERDNSSRARVPVALACSAIPSFRFLLRYRREEPGARKITTFCERYKAINQSTHRTLREFAEITREIISRALERAGI